MSGGSFEQMGESKDEVEPSIKSQPQDKQEAGMCWGGLLFRSVSGPRIALETFREYSGSERMWHKQCSLWLGIRKT